VKRVESEVEEGATAGSEQSAVETPEGLKAEDAGETGDDGESGDVDESGQPS